MHVLTALVLGLSATVLSAGEPVARKVLYLNAYHQGYAWSDEIQKAIEARLGAAQVELKTVLMDTKNDPAGGTAKAQEAKALIEAWKPQVVVISDDNPMKLVVQPYLKDAPIPVVFCGVNWDGSAYGLPYANTAGMYEVALIPQLVAALRKHAKGDRVGLLASDNESSRADGVGFKKHCGVSGLVERYVPDLAAWKAAYVEMQQQVDLLLVRNDGIKGWKADEMAAFCEENARIPTGAIQEEVSFYALATFAKLGSEQGDWAAEAALQILAGKKPSEVGETKNRKAKIILNMKIAKRLGVVPDIALLKQAELVK
jgi:ABC-type uncharacterized transport system substrate-binding protein